MKKKIIIGCGTIFLIVLVAFVCFIMWFANMIDNSLSKKEIIELVNENHSIILDDVNEKEFSDTERIEGIQEIYNKTQIVDFYCGGTGIGSATNYYGFYYSSDNNPKAVFAGTIISETPNFQMEKNGFCIKNSNDDNYYYTEKIRDNFYYYEAHF